MSDEKALEGGETTPGAIDKLIHEPARLLIVSHLAVVESADFLFIMRQTGLTFGNLSSHMSRLEEAGYISVEKKFVGKKPKTILSLSDRGHRAYQQYREQMNQVLTRKPQATKDLN